MPLKVTRLESRLLFDASIAGALAGAIAGGESGEGGAPPPAEPPVTSSETSTEIVASESVTVPEETNIAFDGLEIIDPSLNPIDEISVTLTTTIGTINLGSGGSDVSIDAGGNGEASITFHGTLNQVNAALLSMRLNAQIDYVGEASLFIGVDNGSEQTNHSTSITYTPVNDAPTINTAGLFALLALNETYNFTGFSINDVDVDPDGETLSIAISALQGELQFDPLSPTFQNFTFMGTLNEINALLSSMTYIPGQDFVGFDLVNISVDDLGNTGTGTPESANTAFALIYSDANLPPSILTPDPQLIEQGAELVFSALNQNQISVDDPDSNIISLSISTNDGIIEFGQILPDISVIDGDGDNLAVVSGSITSLNALLTNLTYTPDANFLGDTSINLFAVDGINFAFGNVEIKVVESGDIDGQTTGPGGEDEEQPNPPLTELNLSLLAQLYRALEPSTQGSKAIDIPISAQPWGFYDIDGQNQLTSFGGNIGYTHLVKNGDIVRRFDLFSDSPELLHNSRDTGFGKAVKAVNHALEFFDIPDGEKVIDLKVSTIGDLSAKVEL